MTTASPFGCLSSSASPGWAPNSYFYLCYFNYFNKVYIYNRFIKFLYYSENQFSIKIEQLLNQKEEVELNLRTIQAALSFEPLSIADFIIAWAISLVDSSSLQKFTAS